MEDVEELLQSMTVVEAENEDDDGDNQQEPLVDAANGIAFQGFKSLYKQVINIEEKLLCTEVQVEAEKTFDDLKKSFDSFQKSIHDMFH